MWLNVITYNGCCDCDILIAFVTIFDDNCMSDNHRLHLGKAYCWPLIREQCSINLVINVARCLLQLFSPTTLTQCLAVQLSSLSALVLPIVLSQYDSVNHISVFLLEVCFLLQNSYTVLFVLKTLQIILAITIWEILNRLLLFRYNLYYYIGRLTFYVY